MIDAAHTGAAAPGERTDTMLKLVLGISGSGKTTRLYDALRTRALAGQKSILLVPEQFTSST